MLCNPQSSRTSPHTLPNTINFYHITGNAWSSLETSTASLLLLLISLAKQSSLPSKPQCIESVWQEWKQFVRDMCTPNSGPSSPKIQPLRSPHPASLLVRHRLTPIKMPKLKVPPLQHRHRLLAPIKTSSITTRPP